MGMISIPEPTWERRWWRLWRKRRVCYQHGTLVDLGRSKIPLEFKTQEQWTRHYMQKHIGIWLDLASEIGYRPPE